MFDRARALQLLRTGAGVPGATFRDGQEEAIRSIVEDRGRQLVVQRTGWGKSFVYFIATKLLRERGEGPALLVSPLLALMRNQLLAAGRMGVRAATINSDNQDDWAAVEHAVRTDAVDILLVSPERLANEAFVARTLSSISGRISLLVIDEAHCISDWGHDFRPDYRRIEQIVRAMPRNARILATTATANDRVMKDLAAILGPDLRVSRGALGRPSLALQTIRLPHQAERLAWLASNIPTLPGSGIVYTLTKRDARLVSAWLETRGIASEAYTADHESREELENALLENRIKVLVATTALGMGFDKPDLGFVIHYQTPASVVAYYQQVGRAGRAIPLAHGVLLSGEEDLHITDYFIDNAFPSRGEVERILEAVKAASDGLSVPELEQAVNMSRGRIDLTLKLLALESPAPIAKQGPKWQLTIAPLNASFWDRAERLVELRHAEQAQMQQYVHLQSGHMDFLIRALDGEPDAVAPSTAAALPTTVDPQMVSAATAFLRRTELPFEPRKMWPTGGMPSGARGKIAASLQARMGRALSVWGDAGWGSLVKSGKYEHGVFDDKVVSASAQLVQTWKPDPMPTWVTAIPSARHPSLVPDFAAHLATRLGLPFVSALSVNGTPPEQKTMKNSVQQARNIDGVFTVSAAIPSGPVLLVDDIVDSRWTLTVAAALLREAGSGDVWPFALAIAGGGE